MSSISRCPRCAEQVTIPEGIAAEAQVRCPLCSAEYCLSEALAGVPPALIPVGLVTVTTDAPATEAMEALAAAPEPALAGVAEAALADATHFEAEVMLDTSVEPPMPAATEGVSETATLHPWDKIEDLGEIELEDEEEGESPAEPEEEEHVDAAVFGAVAKAPVEAGEPGAAKPEAPEVPKRRRKRESNPIRTFVGVTVSGFVGLAIAYYFLNLFGGKSYDFLHIYLPFVKHTYQQGPKPDTNGADQSEGVADKPVAMLPGKSKSSDIPEPLPGGFLPEPKKPATIELPAPEEPLPEAPLPDSSMPELPIPTLPVPDLPTPVSPIPKPTKIEPPIKEPSAPETPSVTPPVEEPSMPETPGVKPPVEEPTMPEMPSATPPVEEPAPIEPKAKTLPADYVGPSDPPAFTADDLGTAVKEAEEAFGSGKVTAEGFVKFCRLAEVATFAAAGDADGARAAADLLQRAGKAPDQAAEIGRQAAAVLQSESPRGGILLAGTVLKVVSKGKLHGLTIDMPPMPKPVSIVSRRPLGVDSNDRVVIAGKIIPEPSKNVIGFEGERPMVIWADVAVKVPAE